MKSGIEWTSEGELKGHMTEYVRRSGNLRYQSSAYVSMRRVDDHSSSRVAPQV